MMRKIFGIQVSAKFFPAAAIIARSVDTLLLLIGDKLARSTYLSSQSSISHSVCAPPSFVAYPERKREPNLPRWRIPPIPPVP